MCATTYPLNHSTHFLRETKGAAPMWNNQRRCLKKRDRIRALRDIRTQEGKRRDLYHGHYGPHSNVLTLLHGTCKLMTETIRQSCLSITLIHSLRSCDMWNWDVTFVLTEKHLVRWNVMLPRSVRPHNENTLDYNIQKLSLLNNSLAYCGLHDVITASRLLTAPVLLYSEAAA